ncbi:MAG: histidine kinase dimerization/phospho-acceptor domain-containing protein [Chloroflexota bacterium]
MEDHPLTAETISADPLPLWQGMQILRELELAGGMGSWAADLKTGRLTSGPEGARLLGWTPGEHSFAEFLELVHPDDRDALQACWSAVRQGAAGCAAGASAPVWDIELRVTTGEARWLHQKARILPDLQGRPAYAIGSLQDITERKAIEQDNHRSQAQLEAVMEIGQALAASLNQALIYRALVDGVVRLFPDVGAVFISSFDAGRGMIRAECGSLDGEALDVSELHEIPLAPPGAGGLQSTVIHTRCPLIIGAGMREQMRPGSYVTVGQDGSDSEAVVYVPMLAQNQVLGIIQAQSPVTGRFAERDVRALSVLANMAAVAVQNARLYETAQREVAERKLAENALQELNHTLEQRVLLRTAELQDLYDNAPVGYHALDSEGRLTMVNRTELDWLGYPAGEVLGRQLSDFLTAESAAVFEREFPAFKARRRLQDLELDLVCRDGRRMATLVSATAVLDDQGRYLSSRCTTFDNTGRRAADEALRLANLEMEHAVRLKDEFLANMSHELRTPLNGILGLAEILIGEYRGPLNEDQLKYVQTIYTSGQHLLELINDLLDLSKIEAGKLELHVETVSVQSVCQASLAFVKEQARKKGIRLELRYAAQAASLLADERRLKQILVNLLSNAVKFTPADGQVLMEVTHGVDD